MEKSYILFELDKKVYAIDINFVIEVTELKEIFNASTGNEISIIDLRTLLSLEVSNSQNKEVIVIEKDNYQIGIIVDNTICIRTYDDSLLEDGALLKNYPTDFVRYIIKKKKLIMILDVESSITKLKELKIIS